MTLQEYRATLDGAEAPESLPPLLRALWWDARGDWTRAHEIAQDESGPEAAWVHAYLHRKEGDAWNAGYWYRQTGRPIAQGTLEEEWRELVSVLIGKV